MHYDCLSYSKRNCRVSPGSVRTGLAIDVPLLKKDYAMPIQICNNIERMIKYIEEEAKNFSITRKKLKSFDEFYDITNNISKEKNIRESALIDEINSELTNRVDFLKDQIKKCKTMEDQRTELLEYECSLRKAMDLIGKNKDFKGVKNMNAFSKEDSKTEHLLPSQLGKFANLSGVLDSIESDRFKRFIFRASRGIFISKQRKFIGIA